MNFFISSKKEERFQDVEDFIKKYINEKKELIYIFEFEKIYTVGRSLNNIDTIPNCVNNIKVIKNERGGLWTYHGPGQIICYYVLDLKKRKENNIAIDINFFVSKMEDIIIESLKEIKINAFKHPEEGRGVWIKEGGELKKIAFIGIRISKWFLYYGFSLNYENDLSYFDYIKICDIKTKVTSVKSFLKEKTPSIEDFKKIILEKNKLHFYK